MTVSSDTWPRELATPRRRWSAVTVSDVFADEREAERTDHPDWPEGWQDHRDRVNANDLVVMLATKGQD